MDELRRVTLGEVCDSVDGVIRTGPFGSQLHRADYTDDLDGIPVVMPKDIIDGRIVDSSIARVDTDTVERLASHRMEPGDIVMARRGDIGRRGLVDDRTAGWLCGTGSLRVSLPASSLDPTYLFYFLGSDQAIGWLKGQAIGATMSNLNTDIVRRLEVPRPPLRMQRKVAAVLAAYDQLIENNLRRIEILEEMAQAIYREWFVNFRYPGHEADDLVDSPLGPIPERWRSETFGSIASEVRDGVDPEKVDPTTPYVGLEHLPRQSIALQEWGRVADVKSRKWTFLEADILFGKLRPYFHKVVEAPMAGVCSTDTIVIRAQPQYHDYALLVASSPEFVGHATATAGGTDRPRAQWSDLAGYGVVLPDDAVRDRLSSAVRPMMDLIFNLVRQNDILRSTRDLLLPKLVFGEIDVSDVDIDTSWLAA